MHGIITFILTYRLSLGGSPVVRLAVVAEGNDTAFDDIAEFKLFVLKGLLDG